MRSKQGNPFWLSPIFTPDGQLLNLHQWPGFGDTMQVVDLSKRKLLGPVPTPTDPNQNGPFAWLITNAYAGGVASTVPISPDGLKLYSATDDGVMVLRIPDLKPLARLAAGFKASEVVLSRAAASSPLNTARSNRSTLTLEPVDDVSNPFVEAGRLG